MNPKRVYLILIQRLLDTNFIVGTKGKIIINQIKSMDITELKIKEEPEDFFESEDFGFNYDDVIKLGLSEEDNDDNQTNDDESSNENNELEALNGDETEANVNNDSKDRHQDVKCSSSISKENEDATNLPYICLLYTSPSPRDRG